MPFRRYRSFDGTAAGFRGRTAAAARVVEGVVGVVGDPALRMTELLHRAAARASLAPSVHNTQPWLFRLRDDFLELHADPRRQLHVLDPRKRQLIISCGCALFNARVSVAADGRHAQVEAFPDASAPDFLAKVSIRNVLGGSDNLGSLNPAIDLRHTNRRRYDVDSAMDAITASVVTAAAEAEGASLTMITDPDDRRAIGLLGRQADSAEILDPAYRAELRAWTTDDPLRRDGVPSFAVPHVGAGSLDEIPIRDFDSSGSGWLPMTTASTVAQDLLLVSTQDDDPRAWLAAGEATQRVLLEITRRGYVASPLNQLIEWAETNAALRRQLHLSGHPQMLLRVGRADPTLAVPRRSLGDVIDDRARPSPAGSSSD